MTTHNDTVISVKHLTKSFTIKQKRSGFAGGLASLFRPDYKYITAVDDVSFSVKGGELLAFIGPNGAGKSTTIKMLTGILFPSSGSIDVFGLDPSRSRRKLAYEIGSVFGQKPQLWYHLPPIDTFDLLAKIYEIEPHAYRERLDFLIDAFEIGDLLRTPVRKLSLGQRMRCEIAASLVHRPKIIFLDEPTIGLDVVAKQKIRDIIRTLNREDKVTIFLTSHDAGDVESLAERTIVINHGRIIFDDATEKLKKQFIKTKVVELFAEEELGKVSFPNSTVTKTSPYSVKVELDITNGSVDALLADAMNRFEISDINVTDPPMEEIITHIYQAKLGEL